ncbi:MAG: hypothetical protein LIO81_11140 [Clostridiales bacterium]|nr:hypothetical protein [Clostridiales bacterium]
MGFLDKAKSLSSKTVEGGKRYAEIAKIELSIAGQEDQIKKAKIKIGTYVLENGLPIAEDDAEITALIGDIKQCQSTIAGFREKIDELKASSSGDAPDED